MTRNPDLIARCEPIMQKWIFGNLNQCIFRCDDDAFFKQDPNYKLGKSVIILQLLFKRDATTGLLLKDKVRYTI